LHEILSSTRDGADFWLRTPPGLLHRRDNIRVCAAPADIAAHTFADIVVIRPARFFHQRSRRHHLSRRAVTALKSVMLQKRCLHRMQLPIPFESFDGGNLVSLVHDGKSQTGIYPPSVHMYRTGSALAVIATFFRAEELQVFAQRIKQRYPRLKTDAMLVAIYPEHQGHGFNCLWAGARWSTRPLLSFGFAQQRAASGRHTGESPAKKGAS
jgi:hypothetical protein